MPKVAVVIPIYKKSISALEEVAVIQLKKHLSNYDVIIFKPKSLQELPSQLKNYSSISFPDQYFRNIQSYSKLMLSSFFYQEFNQYKYILIYQLDCLVLSDQLGDWVDTGYDYVGAPWTLSLMSFLTHQKGKLTSVGNGGFCLRKVKSHHKLLKRLEKKYSSTKNAKEIFWWNLIKLNTRNEWFKFKPSDYPFNEDGFWSFEAPKISSFSYPSPKEAAQFSIEKYPQYWLNQTQKLPFGVHAWYRYQPKLWIEKLDLDKSYKEKLLMALS